MSRGTDTRAAARPSLVAASASLGPARSAILGAKGGARVIVGLGDFEGFFPRGNGVDADKPQVKTNSSKITVRLRYSKRANRIYLPHARRVEAGRVPRCRFPSISNQRRSCSRPFWPRCPSILRTSCCSKRNFCNERPICRPLPIRFWALPWCLASRWLSSRRVGAWP